MVATNVETIRKFSSTPSKFRESKDEDSDLGEQLSEGSSAESFFCALEEDHARLRSEMHDNVEFAKWEGEYEKLFDLLYREHKLVKLFQEERQLLKDEIEELKKNFTKLENTIISQDEDNAALHEQIELSKKLVDNANDREHKAHEDARNLKVLIANLEKELEQVRSQAGLQSGDYKDQEKEKPQEKDTHAAEMESLKQNYKFAMNQIKELEKTIDQLMVDMDQKEEALDTKINEVIQEQNMKQKHENTIEKLKQEISDLDARLKLSNEKVAVLLEANSKLERKAEEGIVAQNLLLNETSRLQVQMKDLAAKYSTLHFKNESNRAFLAEKKAHVASLTTTLNSVNETVSRLKTEKEVILRKLHQNEKLLLAMNDMMRQAKVKEEKQDVHHSLMLKALKEEQDKVEIQLKITEELTKSNILNKNLIAKLRGELQTRELSGQTLQTEFNDLHRQHNDLLKRMAVLTRKRDDLVTNVHNMDGKIEEYEKEMKELKHELEHHKKVTMDLELKNHLQENIIKEFNIVKDANEKLLRQFQDESENLKDQLKMLKEQVKLHKDQIVIRDDNARHHEFQLGKLEKENEELGLKLEKAHEQILSFRTDISQEKKLEKELRAEITSLTQALAAQKREIESLKRDRDRLSGEFAKRDAAVEDLKQKLKLRDMMLQRDRAEYEKRLREMRLLKLEVKKVRSEKALLLKKIQNSTDLRREVLQLHRSLTRERIKVTALAEESENPVNVHKWRQLESTDDVIGSQKKISFLNRRILRLSSKLITAGSQIEVAEKENESLREIVEKQYRPELLKELNDTKTALRHNEKRVQSLLGEIGVWMRNKDEHVLEIEKLNNELRGLKEKYYSLKRKQQTGPRQKGDDQKEPDDTKNSQRLSCGDFIMTSVSFDA